MKKLILIFALLVSCSSPAAPVELPTAAPTAEPLPTDTPIPLPTPTLSPPVLIEGDGNDIAYFDVIENDTILTVGGQHYEDRGNFIVMVKRADTTIRGVPINCIGDCRNTDVLSLDAGTYFFDVMARGRWAIAMSCRPACEQ